MQANAFSRLTHTHTHADKRAQSHNTFLPLTFLFLTSSLPANSEIILTEAEGDVDAVSEKDQKVLT